MIVNHVSMPQIILSTIFKTLFLFCFFFSLSLWNNMLQHFFWTLVMLHVKTTFFMLFKATFSKLIRNKFWKCNMQNMGLLKYGSCNKANIKKKCLVLKRKVFNSFKANITADIWVKNNWQLCLYSIVCLQVTKEMPQIYWLQKKINPK